MPRTKLQQAYLSRIDALNDQLWHFLFALEELDAKVANLSNKGKEAFTIDLFANNQFSKRIHVKVGDLKKHGDENKKLAFGSHFSTCYEVVSNYIKGVFDELKSVNQLATYTWDKGKEPEKNLKALFVNNGLALPPAYIFDTFTYLRLRRNHFTHIVGAPNNKLVTFAANEGRTLNAKWRTSKVVQAIDFTLLTNVTEFTQPEVIELIKLLRICLIELDTYIASMLDVNALIRRFTEEEYNPRPTRINSIIIKQRNRTIISKAKRIMGLVINEKQTTPFVKSIGVR